MFQNIYRTVVELGFSIKQSHFFVYYTVFVAILAMILVWMGVRKIQIKSKLSQEVKRPRKTYYNEKISSRDFEKMKSDLTKSELTKLQRSEDYQKFIRDKHNPYSVYNMSKIDALASDVQFSDQQGDKKRQ